MRTKEESSALALSLGLTEVLVRHCKVWLICVTAFFSITASSRSWYLEWNYLSPFYKGYDCQKSVANVLDKLHVYMAAIGGIEEVHAKSSFIASLSGLCGSCSHPFSPECKASRKSSYCWATNCTSFESLTYILNTPTKACLSMCEPHRSSIAESKQVSCLQRQRHLQFCLFLHNWQYSSLQDVARNAHSIQESLLADLQAFLWFRLESILSQLYFHSSAKPHISKDFLMLG